MKIEQLGEKERKILLEALEFSINQFKCKYCNEKIEYESCCIMQPVKGDKNATLTCNSPLCVSEYFEDYEEEKEVSCCQATMDKIFFEIEAEFDSEHFCTKCEKWCHCWENFKKKIKKNE